MKLVIKVVLVRGSCSSAHDKADIYDKFAKQGWTVTKLEEYKGDCYATVEKSK